MQDLTQLYPLPAREIPLSGAYLSHDLREKAVAVSRPYIYSNYIASVDGRIAIPREDGRGMTVPKSTANERDWRLFQELAAQADLIISSGRYLREWASGQAQEILRVDDPRFSDLRDWRKKQGLSAHPDIAIISGSLQFPIPEILTAGNRKVVVFTSANADPEHVRKIERHAVQVIIAGEKSIDAPTMAGQMAELGYRTVFNSTGPKVLHLLLAGSVMDRLYLTQAARLLGGQPFSSVVEGASLTPATDLHLNTLYYDEYALSGLGQLFMSYDVDHG